jgi:tetratricopeptide (TPR) repeat protein
MEFQVFSKVMNEVSHFLETEKYHEAEEYLNRLLISDISDIDKSGICVKLARISDRRGNTQDALNWYEKGISYEQPYYRYDATEQKVQYLAQLGRCQEGVTIYETLLDQQSMTESEKERFRKEIKVLLSRTIGQWN